MSEQHFLRAESAYDDAERRALRRDAQLSGQPQRCMAALCLNLTLRWFCAECEEAERDTRRRGEVSA